MRMKIFEDIHSPESSQFNRKQCLNQTSAKPFCGSASARLGITKFVIETR